MFLHSIFEVGYEYSQGSLCFHCQCSYSALLAWNQSKGFVYAYYVLRTISYILSQGSIFCIAVAYVVRIFPYCC